MKTEFIRKTIAGLLLAAVTQFANTGSAAEPVKIGILHSLSGTMAISETSLRDVVMMAADEINASGGVLGRKIQPVVVDPASNWPLFAEKAKQLITQDKVAVTFGCWTSVSRKSCLPVFEEYNALLFYPVQYEGEEQSLNVFYTAATPNQQLVPAAKYMIDELDAKKFYLLGTDYVFPRTANKVLKAYLLAQGVPAKNIIEEYTPFHHQGYQAIVGQIKKFAADGDTISWPADVWLGGTYNGGGNSWDGMIDDFVIRDNVQYDPSQLTYDVPTKVGTFVAPEPATLSMLGIGGLGLLRRRR